MSDGLFNPEAFEQVPGQMSMEQVEPSFEARWYRWIPDHGSPSGLLAADDREAQLEAAELWHDVPGTLHRTDSWYRCERLPGGFVRALDAES